MRTLLRVVLLSLALAAPVRAQRTRMVVVVPGQMTRVITDTMGTPYPVPFAPDQVYRALLKVYAELKLPAEIKDSVKHSVESNMFYRQGTVAGKQISGYLSCGESITGPNADSYRVYMNMWTTVTPSAEDRAVIKTVLLAGAVNVMEGSRQPMPCESTGRLEVRIHQMVLKQLAFGQ